MMLSNGRMEVVVTRNETTTSSRNTSYRNGSHSSGGKVSREYCN